MNVLIKIPNHKFDNDVKNKFQDYFNRVKQDIADGTLCGNYELETTDMFLASFKRLQVLPDNATIGDMIKIMFPTAICNPSPNGENMCVSVFTDEKVTEYFTLTMDRWNAPFEDCVNEKAVPVSESELAIDHKDHQSQENQLPEDLYEDYIFMMTEKAVLQEKLNEIKKVIETHESAIPASCAKQIKRIVEE